MIDKEMLAAMQLLLEPINARLDELSELKSDVQQLDQRFSSQLGQVEERFSSQLGQVEEKLSSRLDQVENRMDGLSVLLDLEIRKKIDLLVEGQEALMERLPDPAQADDIEHRLSAVEMVVKVHSRDINDLKKAQ
ncbi:hypothetical protein GAG88_27725 [Bacteroides thetaiotaomicron]|nr:hypothetical protein GAG88_27725 [Bacteroides thetaiotaomicron]